MALFYHLYIWFPTPQKGWNNRFRVATFIITQGRDGRNQRYDCIPLLVYKWLRHRQDYSDLLYQGGISPCWFLLLGPTKLAKPHQARVLDIRFWRIPQIYHLLAKFYCNMTFYVSRGSTPESSFSSPMFLCHHVWCVTADSQPPVLGRTIGSLMSRALKSTEIIAVLSTNHPETSHGKPQEVALQDVAPLKCVDVLFK